MPPTPSLRLSIYKFLPWRELPIIAHIRRDENRLPLWRGSDGLEDDENQLFQGTCRQDEICKYPALIGMRRDVASGLYFAGGPVVCAARK